MDSIALRWHSMRGGRGKEDTGWKRFLVFAKLTEKRGRRDYVALFTYFSFKGIWATDICLARNGLLIYGRAGVSRMGSSLVR